MVTIRKATADEKGKTFRNRECLVVEKDGRRCGHIEKAKNTPSFIHPWKVYAPGNVGLVAAFYNDADKAKITEPDGKTFFGGRKAAEAFAREYFKS